MNAKSLIDSTLTAAEKLATAAPATSSTAGTLAAIGPLLTLLPKVVPFVARAVRRHPAQAVVSLIGLAVLARHARQLQRKRLEDSVEDTPLLR